MKAAGLENGADEEPARWLNGREAMTNGGGFRVSGAAGEGVSERARESGDGRTEELGEAGEGEEETRRKEG